MVRRFIQPLSGLWITGSYVPQVSPVAIRIESLRDSSLPKQHYLRLFVLIYSGFFVTKKVLLFCSFSILKGLNSNSPACNAGSMFPPQFSNHVVVEYLQEIFFVKFNAMFVEQVYILLSERFCFMMLLLIFYIFN
jgi:hypothetical protein